MAHSKGNWKIGKNGGTVVTDCLDGFEERTGHGGQQAVDYYGGALIAESIMKRDDAKLIAAAPDLLAALQCIVDYWNTPKKGSLNDHISHSLKLAEAAIKKATG